MSDERRLNPQKRAYRGERYQAEQRCTALGKHIAREKGKGAPRDYSAAGVSTYSRRGTPSAVAALGKDATADCGLSQPSVALKRQPQRIA